MHFDHRSCGKRIRVLRIQRNMTQGQLAESVHISINHLAKIENGRSSGSLELLIDIAGHFDISMDYLLFGKGSINYELRKQINTAIEILETISRRV